MHACHCCPGLGRWAASNDPVLQRYAAGALARVASSGVTGFGAVRDSGALVHLVHAMACGDPQVRCFAAGAVGAHTPLFLAVPLSPGPSLELLCHCGIVLDGHRLARCLHDMRGYSCSHIMLAAG